MPEVNIFPDDAGSSSGSSGSSGGMKDMLGELQEVMEMLQENPQMAQMFGMEPPGQEAVQKARSDGAGDPDGPMVELTPEFITDMIRGLENNGYGSMSVSELREWCEENQDQLENLIGAYA